MSNRLAVVQAEETVKELQDIENALKSIIPLYKETVKEINKINRALKTGQLREYRDAMRDLRNETSQFVNIERQLADAMARVARLELQQARTATENARTRRELAEATRAESRARQEATREQRQNERQTRESTSAHARLTREVREARQRARDYGAEMLDLTRAYRNGDIAQREYRQRLAQLSRDFRNANRESVDLQRQLNRLNRSTTPGIHGSLPGRVTDILKAAGIVNVVDNIASSFYKLGVAAFETSKKIDSLRLAQMSVFKTNTEVNKQNEFLTGIAERYGIEILGLTDAYTKFAASAQGTYLEGTQTQNIFDAVTRSSSLLGVSTDETTGILRALGQMMSKGKVQAEELRGQLGDRMAGAFKLFADGMGVSTAQLDKMLKDGEVLADDVLPKFADQLNKKYKLDLGDQIDTQTAAINRRSNAWTAWVEGVLVDTGIMSKTVLGFNGVLSNMLEALTPSKNVTIIEQEQAQLNMLGRELRNNFKDEKKRKEILEEIKDLNPFFLNGLKEEELTLGKIDTQLRAVNEQYIMKIALQKQEEQIKELVEDQAQAYIYLNRVYSDNIVEYNNLNAATRKAIDDYAKGSITYTKAREIVNKSTKDFTKANSTALDMLWRMNTVIEQSSLNFDGYNRGIKGNEAAIKSATGAYDSLKNKLEEVFGIQKQLVFMNGLTAKSFSKLGKEEKDNFKEAGEIIRKAELQGEKFALVRNVWRQQNKNGTWSTTNKKETEGWYLFEGKLLQRQKTKVENTEKAKASSLSAIQKDYIKDLQANRDTELAVNETNFTKGKVSELKYWDEVLRINTSFYNKKMGYLKGKNAEERKQIADADLDQAKLVKTVQEKRAELLKESFEKESKVIEENYKIQSNLLERESKRLEKADFFTNEERLDKQIENDNESIAKANEYYNNLINLAKAKNQETLTLERKRDDEIGQLEERRDDNVRSRFQTSIDDLNIQAEMIQNQGILSSEEKRNLVLSNKKLTSREREYQLSILDRENQIELNKLEIARLETIRSKISAKKFLTAEDEKEIAELSAMIQTLQNANVDIDISIKEEVNDKLKAIYDTVSKGLTDLGFEGLGNTYAALMERLKGQTGDWKDYTLLAATAVFDALGNLSDRQKEKRIKALDDELKASQETTEQEIGFINQRLSQLNALETLTEEQMHERNRLEDEARTYKEQQAQREKLIEAQKARAEQRAAAQQALINGALAATMTLAQLGFIAGAIPAALALGFGIAQSVSIMSKDPVPKYFIGRRGGKAEMAITQDGGRELITDKKGNIKSLGSDSGDQLTWLDAGDNVHTAKETKSILKRMVTMPKIGDNIYKKIAMQNMIAPQLIVSNNEINYDLLADKIGSKFEKSFKRYDKPAIIKNNGKILMYRGANFGVEIGEYDKNGKETYYIDDTN